MRQAEKGKANIQKIRLKPEHSEVGNIGLSAGHPIVGGKTIISPYEFSSS